jgi:rRNA maturation endonuclease Nob1
MEATENTKARPTTDNPNDWAVNCLDCGVEFKIGVGGFWPSAPRCYDCGSKRHFDRIRRNAR